jgi:hypothetical protein
VINATIHHIIGFNGVLTDMYAFFVNGHITIACGPIHGATNELQMVLIMKNACTREGLSGRKQTDHDEGEQYLFRFLSSFDISDKNLP